ncbi:MAG: hypothetical protein ACI9SP_004560 [Arenicella sp.]|jgi:hypothetical protein
MTNYKYTEGKLVDLDAAKKVKAEPKAAAEAKAEAEKNKTKK